MSYPGDENPMFRKREPPTWQPHGQQAPGQPYGDQQPVWQDQQRPQFQRTPPTNGLAITSLVLSIASFVALPLIGSIGGVVCGHIARDQLRRSREPEQGDGLALAGLIIGWIGIAFYVLLLLIIFGVIFAAA
jgi:hypothetical protein